MKHTQDPDTVSTRGMAFALLIIFTLAAINVYQAYVEHVREQIHYTK